MTSEMGVSLASRLVKTSVKGTEQAAKQEAPTASERQPEKSGEIDQPQKQLSAKDMSQAAEQLNELIQTIRRELRFAVDKECGRTVISVIDSQSGERIRQIPPDEILTLISHIRDSGAGLYSEEA